MRHIESYFIYRFHMSVRVFVWCRTYVACDTLKRLQRRHNTKEYTRTWHIMSMKEINRQWCYVFETFNRVWHYDAHRKKEKQNGMEHMSRIKMFNLNKIQNIHFFKALQFIEYTMKIARHAQGEYIDWKERKRMEKWYARVRASSG